MAAGSGPSTNCRKATRFGFPRLASSTGAPPPPARLAAEMLDRVIYEDKRLLVINKPTGVAVHGGSGISHGVIELLRHARPDLKELGARASHRPGDIGLPGHGQAAQCTAGTARAISRRAG